MDDAGTGPLASRERTRGYRNIPARVGPGMLHRTIHAIARSREQCALCV